MNHLRFKNLILSIAVILFFTGCGAISASLGTMLGGGSSTTGTAGSTEVAGPTGSSATQEGTGTTTGTDATEDSGTNPGDTGVGIQGSIPLPNNVIVSDTNSSASAQLLGSGLDANYSLLVTSSGAQLENNSEQKTFLALLIDAGVQPLYLAYDYYQLKTGKLSAGQFFSRYIVPTVKVRLLTPIVTALIGKPAFAATSACTGTVIPINADGTVSYELPDAVGKRFSIQYVAKDAAAAGDCSTAGAAVYEEPTSAVQYVAGDVPSVHAIAFDGTDSACSVVTATDAATNSMQEMAYTADSGFEVAATSAEHTTCAVSDAALVTDALALDFNETHAHLLLQDATGISNSDGRYTAIGCTGDCTPTRMKEHGEKEYYATDYGDEGYEYGYLIDFETHGAITNDILFYSDPSVGNPSFKQTLAYDVDDSDTALVVFETATDLNGDGDYSDAGDVAPQTMVATKIHNMLVNETISTPYQEVAPTEFNGVIDIWSYTSAATNDSSNGQAVLLTSNKLHQVDYDAIATNSTTTTSDPCEGIDAEEAADAGIDCSIISNTTTSGDAQSIELVSSLSLTHTATAMVINDTKDTVYILNTDNSVTAVGTSTLTEVVGFSTYDAVTVDGTVELTELQTALGYDFDYALTAIKYVTTDDGAHYLLLGANGLDSVLTIPVD